MEEIKKMNVNGIGAGYPAAGKAKVRQAQDGTQSFDREFMGMASQTLWYCTLKVGSRV